MAVSHEVGYNRHSTPKKQFAFTRAASHLVPSSAAVAAKYGLPCYIIDMTAGPGRDRTGSEGSPLILARLVTDQIEIGRPVILRCAEQFGDSLAALRAEMASCYPGLAVEYYSDQAKALDIPTNSAGFTYWDPTRYKDLDAALLASFGRSHRMMDVLITRSCNATKRMRCAGVPDTLTIFQYLELTGKRKNYIWQYADWDWWSFGFASNWEQRPAGKMGGLYDVTSREARRNYYKLFGENMSQDEQSATVARQGEIRWA